MTNLTDEALAKAIKILREAEDEDRDYGLFLHISEVRLLIRLAQEAVEAKALCRDAADWIEKRHEMPGYSELLLRLRAMGGES